MFAPGKPAQRLPDIVERGVALGLLDQAGTGDRTSVDHRIERLVVRRKSDGVEGFAARFDADRGADAEQRGAARADAIARPIVDEVYEIMGMIRSRQI